MSTTPKKTIRRAEAIANSYTQNGLFKPEIVSCGSQMVYEMEQDLIAMRWAISYLQEALQVQEKHSPNTPCGQNQIRQAFDVLVKRVSEYSCPSTLKEQHKTKETCPLKDNCRCCPVPVSLDDDTINTITTPES